MDINTMSQIIGSIGFPIAAFLLIFREMQKQSERHENEMAQVSEVLNQNTLAINTLCERLQNRGENQ